jgi:putative oxidoreductase
MTKRENYSEMLGRATAAGWALLPLRLIVGFGFTAHGFAKLSRGPEHFATILSAMAIPFATPMAWATSLLELLGGVALMLGLAVVPVSVPLAVIMLTALFGVHARYGFSSIRLKGFSATGAEFGPIGYELNLMYIAALVTIAASRSSPLSVDRWLATRKTARAKH